jgi:hypothetical protein
VTFAKHTRHRKPPKGRKIAREQRYTIRVLIKQNEAFCSAIIGGVKGISVAPRRNLRLFRKYAV